MPLPTLREFRELAQEGNVIGLSRRLMSDQLTPVLGYRRLVAPDDRTAPSFLFESVEGGATVGRYSYIGAQPSLEVIAYGHNVTIINARSGDRVSANVPDPLMIPKRLMTEWRVVNADTESSLRRPQHFFRGGWVGYAGYDAVRYLEADKLPFDNAPTDDRNLPDMHFGLYRQIGVFDHVDKVLHAITHIMLDEHASIDQAYRAGCDELELFIDRLRGQSAHRRHPPAPLPPGMVDVDVRQMPRRLLQGNFGRGGGLDFEAAVEKCKQYIAAGDALQIVLSQRFERQTTADPFEIYRALRIVNPSPYMIYLQARDSILVASSPEILCRCVDGIVTSRPLAGTRPRGSTKEEDLKLERELLADEKERAEHVMLVDLGRNDLARVCEPASIKAERLMDVERYSHVMHLSSTITGKLRKGLDCWDALRNTLPVGTVSGAPKVRAMQIIDELEPTRRGPYAGGIGAIGLDGDMDVAIALRMMVIPTAHRQAEITNQAPAEWMIHLQAGAGVVADSIPQREQQETVEKAAALARAIDLAESAFASGNEHPRDSAG